MESPASKSAKENRVPDQAFSTPAKDYASSPNENANTGERQKTASDSRFERILRSPIMSEQSAALNHSARLKFHDVFQMKQGRYADLPAAKISEMMTSNSLDNAPTQSLLSVVNGILDEGLERRNGEIPQRVALLLRKVIQEIERRTSTQAEHLRTQSNLFKAREEKYQSRIKVLETLASNTCREAETERTRAEEIRNLEEEMVRAAKEMEMEKKKYELNCMQIETEAKRSKLELKEKIKELEQRLADSRNEEVKEKEDSTSLEILTLRRELEMSKKANEVLVKEMEAEAKRSKEAFEEHVKELEERLAKSRNSEIKEKNSYGNEISSLKQELEAAKNDKELCVLQLEKEASRSKAAYETRIEEVERQLAVSRNKLREVEKFSETQNDKWSKKMRSCRSIVEFQVVALRELRFSSQSVKQEVRKAQQSHSEEFNHFGTQLKSLTDAAQNYHVVLAENQRLFNEIQELKGNIRVYCRIRPFLPGQKEKQSIVEHVGDNGELVVANPAKPGKDGRRPFKFNKVFGPASSQAEVYSDVQPFVQSVLDGYNVCIFAYGQTGSGKTYTMTGPEVLTKESWGVNYRALNDLFEISESRKSLIHYEITVQMVEIYNEQVRDLLTSDGAKKKLGVVLGSQSSGLAVPDASIHFVKAPTDVLDLIDIGMKNRAVGGTAMNQRSSRSHSVVSIHARGMDSKTGNTLRGCLHLIDLAGSERVDRSEATGDRLKEAQHINKSLSALGDVIFALSQKSAHVPYRNSKLTQILQSSLGGQAKTLMFVQLNPDTTSYSESSSTLKFAERVSGVELGAAKSSKDGRDVRDLVEQVASLKDAIAKRDEEIERLQLPKDLKNIVSDKISESDNLEDSGRASDFENGDQDYEERSSNHSEQSIENASEGTDQSDSLDRIRTASRVSRIAQKVGQNAVSPKGATSIKKSSSGSILNKPPRPWA